MILIRISGPPASGKSQICEYIRAWGREHDKRTLVLEEGITFRTIDKYEKFDVVAVTEQTELTVGSK
jgi:broad-specificity NMP kinase